LIHLLTNFKSMAKAIYMAQIRKRMESIQREYNALSEAYHILQNVGTGRGRKAKIPTLQEMLGAEVKVKTGKRGRPPGAKNKPGAKKPGPKPKNNKAVATAVASANNNNSAVKASQKKVVNKVSKAPTVKVKEAKRVAKASKPEVKIASKKSVKPVSRKSGKRNRIPNLAEKIQDIVGRNARFTTNAVITDKLSSLYPGKSRSDLGKYISVILANMKARKELAVVTQDAKGNKMRSGLWGLPGWFEGSKPKTEFLK